MIPVYLADMDKGRERDNDIYVEFLSGNWVVNKNPSVPFCVIGADHALEHINRSMKVVGGRTGITLNANARNKFFLTAPEMSRLTVDAEEMVGGIASTTKHHHASSQSILTKQEHNIDALKVTICRVTNPFVADCDGTLSNVVTKQVVPDAVKEDMREQRAIGNKLFDEFLAQRITSSAKNIWAPMKKCNLKTCRVYGKTMKMTADNKN